MMNKRLMVLIAITLVLAALRVLAPLSPQDSVPAIAEAVMQKPTPTRRIAAPTNHAQEPGAHIVADLEAVDVPGNAFAVRPPAPPPYVPPATVANQERKLKPLSPDPSAAIAAIAPPQAPAPPMPYQVIGTWDDGKSPGVFLAGPTGTLFAHAGETVQAEYKVLAITGPQLTLLHIPSKHEFQLNVPRPPATLPQPLP